jgi:hypothetical protein
MKNIKVFLVVFVVALAANVVVAMLFERILPNSRWSWDTTTTSALIVAIAATVLMGKKKAGGMEKANQVRAEEHMKMLARVRALFDTRTEVSNNDVQEALGIADSTATNYLSELESAGAITQIGNTGTSVTYRLK